MRKTAVPLATAVFMVASTFNLQAATVAGVNLPDTTTVGDKTLVLNGLGLRTEFMVKVYVGGLYLEHKSTDAGGIIKADAPKRIVMQFLHDASKKQMTAAFDQSFKDNAPTPRRRTRPIPISFSPPWSRSRWASKWSSPMSRVQERPSLSTAKTN